MLLMSERPKMPVQPEMPKMSKKERAEAEARAKQAAMMAALGALLGLALLYAGLFVGQPLIDSAFGLWIPIEAPTIRELWVLLAVIAASAIVSMVPALRAYRMSLTDGMMVRI